MTSLSTLSAESFVTDLRKRLAQPQLETITNALIGDLYAFSYTNHTASQTTMHFVHAPDRAKASEKAFVVEPTLLLATMEEIQTLGDAMTANGLRLLDMSEETRVLFDEYNELSLQERFFCGVSYHAMISLLAKDKDPELFSRMLYGLVPYAEQLCNFCIAKVEV